MILFVSLGRNPQNAKMQMYGFLYVCIFRLLASQTFCLQIIFLERRFPSAKIYVEMKEKIKIKFPLFRKEVKLPKQL